MAPHGTVSSAETLVTLPNPYFTLFPFWVFVIFCLFYFFWLRFSFNGINGIWVSFVGGDRSSFRVINWMLRMWLMFFIIGG